MRHVLDVRTSDGTTTVVYIGNVVRTFYNESDESDEILVARHNASARQECLFTNGKWVSSVREGRILSQIRHIDATKITHITWRELFIVRD